jgi:putative lipoprotein
MALKQSWTFSALLAALCLLCLPAAAREGRVTGAVSYRERIALPPGFVVKVALLDVSRQDGPAETIGEVELTPARQVPIPYEIAFDEDRIDPRRGYAVRGQIFVSGQLWFTTAQVYPVLTRGAPREADLMLQRVVEPKADAAVPPAFIGDWLVEEISGRGVLDNGQSTPPSTLAFAADGQVHGAGGCNRFAGAAKFAGDSLAIGPLAATMMACIPAVADQERRYFDALSNVRSARIDGDALILAAADGAALVRLIRNPSVALMGYGDKNPACLEWSDGCAVCTRADDGPHCSTPGIACQPAEIACRRRAD